jgi:phosphatidylinositol-3-phosphatase
MGRAPRALVVLLALLALAPARASAASPLPPIKHVFVIVLENKGFDETFGYQSAAPYLSLTLPGKGALVPNFYGVTHESLGNYLALVSGQGSNVLTQADCQLYVNVIPGTIRADGQAIGDGCVYPSGVRTIADQLTRAGLTWKGYMEDMGNAPGQPQTCRHPAFLSPDSTQRARVGDQYAARHNPFVYFHSLLDSGACARYDVPLDRLPADLASAASTPNYSFITPNLCNDGHDATCVDGHVGGLTGDNRFLSTWVPRILRSPAYRAGGLLAVVFDESDGTDSSACCGERQFPNVVSNGFLFPGLGGGRTGAVLLSPYIDPGTVDNTAYNHFSLLRSTEDLFGLGHLGYAAQAGLRSLGVDAFTCYRAAVPRPRHGRLPAGSLIKLAVIGQGTAPRPQLELKLWHLGRVSIKVGRRGGPARTLAPCQLQRTRLPTLHGAAVITVRAYGGIERRTITF